MNSAGILGETAPKAFVQTLYARLGGRGPAFAGIGEITAPEVSWTASTALDPARCVVVLHSAFVARPIFVALTDSGRRRDLLGQSGEDALSAFILAGSEVQVTAADGGIHVRGRMRVPAVPLDNILIRVGEGRGGAVAVLPASSLPAGPQGAGISVLDVDAHVSRELVVEPAAHTGLTADLLGRRAEVLTCLSAAHVARRALFAVRRAVQGSDTLRRDQVIAHLLTPAETEGDFINELARQLAEEDADQDVEAKTTDLALAAARFAARAALTCEHVESACQVGPQPAGGLAAAVIALTGPDWQYGTNMRDDAGAV